MHITEMTVGPASHPAFLKNVTLRFHDRVNVFIGSNASGKTSVLRVLANSGLVDDTVTNPYQPVSIYVSDDWQQARNPYHVEGQLDWDEHVLVDVPFGFIPAVRVNLSGLLDFDNRQLPFDKANVFGQNRDGRLDPATIETAIDWPDNVQIFDGRWIADAISAVFEEYQRDPAGPFRRYPSMVRLAHTCAKYVAGEIIVGGPSNYVADDFATVVYAPDEIEPLALKPSFYPGMGVRVTTGRAKGSVQDYAGNLSAGTQSVYLWMLYLAFKMACFYKFQVGWNTKHAILLIDEIENHLHPTWQRRVIPALLEHFPGLQIFATKHSPFVVAGLKKGQVHMLKRDESGVVTASPNEQDIIGWTTDEILRTFMGVDEPTDQLTVDRRERLLELRRKESLTDDEQAAMEELRRQVNKDFLSSSTPLEAQRERYGDMMFEFLRSRQSDLSQDGS